MSATATSPLQSVCVIEKDTNGDVMISWSYPIIEPDMQDILQKRTPLNDALDGDLFVFSKYKSTWIYSLTKTLPSAVNKVVAFSVCVLCKEFDPEKYSALCTLLCNLYSSNNNSPIKICEAFLALFTTGKYFDFKSADFDPLQAKIAAPLTNVFRYFQDMEAAALIWNALILKKRVFVFCEDITQLLAFVRALPCLVLHRQQNGWDILRPYMKSEELTQHDDLSTTSTYIAGFLVSDNPSLRNQEKWYDLLIDVSSQSVRVAEHAKSDFALTKMHIEVQNIITKHLQDNEDDSNDQELIKAIVLKTKEILNKLKSLQEEDEQGVTALNPATLKELNLSETLERFLLNIAIAENLTK